MVFLVHDNNIVLEVLDNSHQPVTGIELKQGIAKTLLILAEKFPRELLIWSNTLYKENVNFKALEDIFHHARILASYNPERNEYLPKEIGYIERSFYLKINKEVKYPTWLMNGIVGGVYAKVILRLKENLDFNCSFNYFLNSLAKRAMVEGLFCYSEPNLFIKGIELKAQPKQATISELFIFVRQHYKWVWVIMLSLCYAVYEKKSTFIPLLRAFTYNKLRTGFNLEAIKIKSTRDIINKKEIDVIIPTIGRKKYLYDVLKDLSQQTILPKNVIIVEQNPNVNSKSELGYLRTENWPFSIKHHFIHNIGVCNARNLALSEVTSEWCLLGDDDNRFKPSLIEDLFKGIKKTGINVGTTVYLQAHEKQTFFKMAQTSIFGAGNSILKSSLIKSVSFNPRFEFNYGEDTEFGMQLRNKGEDVIFYPEIKINHLKAPIGGYRTKVKQLWEADLIEPKPSPTIMLLKKTNFTNPQLKGYKLLLLIKHYKFQSIKNPFKYIANFKKQWDQSDYWSSVLMQQKDA